MSSSEGQGVGDAGDLLADVGEETAVLRQLAQRITGRYHLEPLSRQETQTYIDHRLKVAGAVGQIFTPAAKRELYRLTGGVPRMINVIADRAMLGAFTQEENVITPKLLRKAAAEVYDTKFRAYAPWYRWTRRIAAVALAGGVVIGIGWALTSGHEAAVMACDALGAFGSEVERRWQRRHREIVGAPQRRCRVISLGLRHPALLNLATAALARAPSIARFLTDPLNADLNLEKEVRP